MLCNKFMICVTFAAVFLPFAVCLVKKKQKQKKQGRYDTALVHSISFHLNIFLFTSLFIYSNVLRFSI